MSYITPDTQHISCQSRSFALSLVLTLLPASSPPVSG